MSGKSGRRGGAHAEGHGGDERWIISYADLVTLLLGFFIILYATSELDIERFEAISLGLAQAFNVPVKEGAVPEGNPLFEGGRGILPGPINSGRTDPDLAVVREALAERERARQIEPGQIEVTAEDDRIVFRVADSLVFPSASAFLRPEALPLLQVIGEVIRELPNEIRVEGHTDTVPVATERYPSNWELSSARATAVLRYLTEDVGVEASRIFAAGYGEFRPIASNETPEGRALNRRADIVVLYEVGGEIPELDGRLSPPLDREIAPDVEPAEGNESFVPDLTPDLAPAPGRRTEE